MQDQVFSSRALAEEQDLLGLPLWSLFNPWPSLMPSEGSSDRR